MNSSAPLPDDPAADDSDDNPLWLVAVAMAGLFVLLACLMSS